MSSVRGLPVEGGQTRVTLAGSARRVDVVVPSGEPVGRLVPEALRLVDDRTGGSPRLRQLVTLDGRVLHPDESLREAGIVDGAVLRVVGLAEAPPPPVVLDVTEEVADLSGRSRARWGATPRWWTCTALAVGAALLSARLAAQELDRPAQRTLLVLTATAVLLAGGVLARWASRPPARHAGTALALVGGALGVHAGLVLAPGGLPAAGAALLAVALAVSVLGAGPVLGRGGLVGGGVALVVLLGWVLAERGLPAGRAAGVLVTGSTVLTGLLPRLALVTGGLTALDDQRAADRPVARSGVVTALADAHRALALAVLVAAGSAATAGWRLVESRAGWGVGLTALALVVLALRARAFPLWLEVAAMVAATAVLGVALGRARLTATGSDRPVLAAVAAALALGALLVPAVPVPEHIRARLRRVADRLELVATVALLPVLVGLFGLYGRLLRSF